MAGGAGSGYDQNDGVPGQTLRLRNRPERSGVGYGAWTHIDGWSESVIGYVRETERTAAV